jgi:Ca-activated chloride channel family protein
MWRFQHFEYLWLILLLAIPILLYVLSLINRNKKIKLLGDEALVNKLMPTFHLKRNHIRFGLIIAALFVGTIGLANLQKGSRSEKVERKGIDLIIALDVSKSMLAKDISPNRLEKSKQFIARLLEKVSNNRIGLVLFAGKAYVSVPLTVDISALKMNLAAANPDMLPTQGTVIGDAIEMARKSFNNKETKYKSLVIISDGEDHDEKAKDQVKQALDEGIMISTIGIGSPEGSVIWDDEMKQNKRDEQGNEVISKLNEASLQTIAQEGQGIYVKLQNTESAAETIAEQINSSEQKNFGDMMFSDFNSYFQYFLIITFVLLLLEYLITERKKLKLA